MRRLTIISVVAGSMVFMVPATAAGAVYGGHIKGVPGSQFDLTVSKADGKRFVDRLDFAGAAATCENGPSTLSGNVNFGSPDNRVRSGSFDFKYEFGGGDCVRLAGDLKGGGKAAGTFKDRVTFGSPAGVCKTDKLEWAAKKP